jgi:hypothetical protein
MPLCTWPLCSTSYLTLPITWVILLLRVKTRKLTSVKSCFRTLSRMTTVETGKDVKSPRTTTRMKRKQKLTVRGQFHQRITCSFCVDIFAPKVQTLNLSTNKLRAKLLYEKYARKMLVKFTQGYFRISSNNSEGVNAKI